MIPGTATTVATDSFLDSLIDLILFVNWMGRQRHLNRQLLFYQKVWQNGLNL